MPKTTPGQATQPSLTTPSPSFTFERSQALLLVITVIGALLRFYDLGTKSLWVDEIGQAWYARSGPLAALQGATTHVAAAPLDYIVSGIIGPFTTSEFAFRLPAAIWGTLAIGVIYLIGAQLFNSKHIGLVAATLLAFSPVHIEYSQELRFYSLFVLLALLMVYTFGRAMQAPSRRHWITFGVASALGVLTHYYALFVLGGLVVLVLLNLASERIPSLQMFQLRSDRLYLRPFALCTAIAVLLVAAWYVYSGGGTHTSSTFEPPSRYSISVIPVMGFYRPDTVVALWLLPLLALLGLALSLRQRNPWGLFCGWLLLLSIPSIFVMLSVFSYFYHPRQLLFLVPFYLLLVAAGIVWALEALIRQPRYALLATTAITLALAGYLVPYIQAYYQYPKSNWRDTALFLSRASEGDKAGVVAAPESLNMKKYLLYYQPGIEIRLVPQNLLFENAPAEKRPLRLWLVSDDAFLTHIAKGWTRIDMGHPLGRYGLSYLGWNVDEAVLWHEIAQQTSVPSVLSYSRLLPMVYRQSPEEARDLAARFANEVDHPSMPLMDIEKGALLTQIARVYFDSNQIDRAFETIKRAYSYSPDNLDTLLHVGLIYTRANQCAAAVTILKASPRLNKDAPVNGMLGSAYRCLKQWDQAIQAYQQSYDIKPNAGDLFSQARIYSDAGQAEQARQVIEKLLNAYPQSPEAAKAQDLLKTLNGTTP